MKTQALTIKIRAKKPKNVRNCESAARERKVGDFASNTVVFARVGHDRRYPRARARRRPGGTREGLEDLARSFFFKEALK